MQFTDILFNESSVIWEVRLSIWKWLCPVTKCCEIFVCLPKYPKYKQFTLFHFHSIETPTRLETYRSLGFKKSSDQELLCLIALWQPLLSWCRKRWIWSDVSEWASTGMCAMGMCCSSSVYYSIEVAFNKPIAAVS